jgi:Flp pilus assembly pilin Flp
MSRTCRWHGRLVGAHMRIMREDGQAIVEYALVLALIAIVSIAALKALGLDISNLLDETSSQMASVTNP